MDRSTQQQQRIELAKAFGILFQPGQIVELRVLGIGGRKTFTASGYFDDAMTFTNAAVAQDERKPLGVYVTLNPVNPACLTRSPNRTKDYPGTTSSDADIVRRHWFLVDIDAVRPAETSSTAEQVAAAGAKARTIIADLGTAGWPAPVLACSGNGAHVLYRVDLPNTPEITALCKASLEALHRQYSDPAGQTEPPRAKIDTSVYNPARICRCYGTVARKGEWCEDYPHRMAYIVESPGETFAEIPVVEQSQLAALAARIEASPDHACDRAAGPAGPKRRQRHARQHDAPFDMAKYITDHRLNVTRDEEWQGGRRYILDHCLFDSSHDGTSAALILTSKGAPAYKCQHESCTGNQWAEVAAKYPPASQITDTSEWEVPGGGKGEAKGKKKGGESEQPFELAKDLLVDCFMSNGHCLLRYYRGDWWQYNGHCYRITNDIDTQATLWLGDNEERTSRRIVGDVVACLKALTGIPPEIETPVWSQFDNDALRVLPATPPAEHLIPVANGVLRFDAAVAGDEDCLLPSTPALFATYGLPYPYDPAITPTTFYRYLEAVTSVDGVPDPDTVDMLGEFAGYILSPHMIYEKILYLEGPSRSGKSTLLRAMAFMVGVENTCAPSLIDLGTSFGLASMLHAKLAIISDAHMPKGVDAILVCERLKTLSGGDLVEIHRKYKDAVKVRISAKLAMASNELLKFPDTMQVVPKRLLIASFPNSFFGHEDRRLETKLAAEASGILNWALDGAARLARNGAFTMSKRTNELLEEMSKLGSPISAFVDDACEVGPGAWTYSDDIWGTWVKWCDRNGHRSGGRSVFFRDLSRVVPNIKLSRDSTHQRRRYYSGIEVKNDL